MIAGGCTSEVLHSNMGETIRVFAGFVATVAFGVQSVRSFGAAQEQAVA